MLSLDLDLIPDLDLDLSSSSSLLAVHHAIQPGHAHAEKSTPNQSPALIRRASKERLNEHSEPVTSSSASRKSKNGGISPVFARRSKSEAALPAAPAEIKIEVPSDDNADGALAVPSAPNPAPAVAFAPEQDPGEVDAATGAPKTAISLPPPAKLERKGSWMSSKLHHSTKGGSRLKKISVKKASGGNDESSHGEDSANGGHAHTTVDIGREVFYAREVDHTRATSADRRNEIRTSLHKVLEDHNLHGEVLVRLLHESEMALAHSVPRLDQQQKQMINIVRCVGKHHKELLHEICDVLDAQECDVVHADMDTTTPGVDVNVFYIQNK